MRVSTPETQPSPGDTTAHNPRLTMPETLTDLDSFYHVILCGCGWGELAANPDDLDTLEETGCPVCGCGFTVEEGWAV